MFFAVLAATIGSAGAADEAARHWEQLFDARLVEAADGTPAVAAMYYRELLTDLPKGDPLRPTVLYWLGRTLFVLGDEQGALTPLREAAQSPERKEQAEGLLGLIELEQRRVAALPVRYAFSDGPGAFVRGWQAGQEGGLGTREGVLVWETMVHPGEVTHLALSFEEGLPVNEVHFRVKAEGFPADVQVTLHDTVGGRYSAPLVGVPTDGWLSVKLPVSVFRSISADRSALGGVLLLEIEDLTGYLSNDRGAHSILLDDFVIR